MCVCAASGKRWETDSEQRQQHSAGVFHVFSLGRLLRSQGCFGFADYSLRAYSFSVVVFFPPFIANHGLRWRPGAGRGEGVLARHESVSRYLFLFYFLCRLMGAIGYSSVY